MDRQSLPQSLERPADLAVRVLRLYPVLADALT